MQPTPTGSATPVQGLASRPLLACRRVLRGGRAEPRPADRVLAAGTRAAPGGREDIALRHLVPPLLLCCPPGFRLPAVHTLERLVRVKPAHDELRLTVAGVRGQQLPVHWDATSRLTLPRGTGERRAFGRCLGGPGFLLGVKFSPTLLPALHARSLASEDRDTGWRSRTSPLQDACKPRRRAFRRSATNRIVPSPSEVQHARAPAFVRDILRLAEPVRRRLVANT